MVFHLTASFSISVVYVAGKHFLTKAQSLFPSCPALQVYQAKGMDLPGYNFYFPHICVNLMKLKPPYLPLMWS